MELHKKSELSLGSAAFVIDTSLAGDAEPAIETKVTGVDGAIVYRTSQDISALKPIFQNSQQVFARLEAQHRSIVEDMQNGRLRDFERASSPASADPETDALEHAIGLLGKGQLDKATAALRAVLETYPNCSEARELLEVSYKASSQARLPVDVELALARGIEAFAEGRQRDAIEAWKQCLIEEPGNRLLQLLVLLSTTWSSPRRLAYAREVLAGSDRLLKSGRPAEAQALLLVAQTVEGAGDATVAGLPPKVGAVPENQAETTARKPAQDNAETARLDTLLESPEKPAPAGTADDATKVGPPPQVTAPEPPGPPPREAPVQARPDPIVPSEPEPRTASAAAAPAQDATGVGPSPKKAPPSPPAPPRAAAGPAEPKPDSKTATTPPEARKRAAPDAEKTAPEAQARPAPPRPHPPMRRPMARPPRRNPWPLLGAVAGALVVVGGLAFWLLAGGSAIPQARLEQAASLVSAGQYVQGIGAYDGLLDDYGERSELFLGRGRAKLSSGDAEGGLADLKRAYDLDSQASAIAEEIADLSYSRGNYTDAIAYYEKAFALGAGSAEGRYRLAASLVQSDRGDEAITHLQAAIGKDPAHGEAQFLYGQLLNARGRYAEAERAFRAAQAHVEAGGDFLAQLGVALLEQGKLDEAEETSRDFIRAYPNDARARSLLGEVYLRREQFEAARAQLIQALRTNPTEPRAQIALGRTWLAIGKARDDAQDLGKARQVLESARGVDEGQRLLGLGLVSLATGDLEQARSLLDRSLGEGAPELEVRLALAEASARDDDLVGAAEDLQRASGLAPDDTGISLSLAVVYSQLEETDRAAEQFLRTLQGIGLLAPPGEDAGPVVLPRPYVPLPNRYDVNRSIRDVYQAVLSRSESDPTATELKTLAEPTNFVFGSAR